MKYDERTIIESLLNKEVPRIKNIDFGTMKIEIVKHDGKVSLLNVAVEEKKKPEDYISKNTKVQETIKPYRSWKDVNRDDFTEEQTAGYRLSVDLSEGE